MNDLGNTESPYFLPKEPEEQVKERKAELGKVKEGIRLLEEIISRFDERIAFYDSNKSITSDVETTPEEHLRGVLANRITVENLNIEKDYLVGLRDAHSK